MSNNLEKKKKLRNRLFLTTAVLAGAMLTLPVQVFAQDTQLNDYLDQIIPENAPKAPTQPTQNLPGVGTASQDPSKELFFAELMNEAAEDDSADMQDSDSVLGEGGLPDIPAINSSAVENPGMNLPVNGSYSGGGTSVMQQQAMRAKALEEQIRREAFDAAITGLFPLTPDNVRTLLERNEEMTYARDTPISGIPAPQVNVETISLDPGVKPLTLKTSAGFITTLNILDVTGAPWPIQDVSWAGEYEVVEPEEGGHVIRITPMAKTAYGNMSIRLLTLKTPVTIQLETNPDQVQYRVDARVPEYGPFAEAPLIEGGSHRVAGDTKIMSILDGVYPDKAEKLYVSGVDARTSAYKLNNMTYVRTPLTLISPSWDQSVSSADGMNVYAMRETPVILLSDNGQLARANITTIPEESEKDE